MKKSFFCLLIIIAATACTKNEGSNIDPNGGKKGAANTQQREVKEEIKTAGMRMDDNGRN